METKISDFQSENKTIRKMTLFLEFSLDTDVNRKFIRFYGNILELIRIKETNRLMRILAVFMLSNVSESRGSDCFMFLSITLINVKIKDEFPVTVFASVCKVALNIFSN